MTAAPDAPGDAYYVAIRRGSAFCYAAGPFPDRTTADAWVDPVRDAAYAVDPWTGFDSFGTAHVTTRTGRFPPGRLNHRLGLPTDPVATTVATAPGGPPL